RFARPCAVAGRGDRSAVRWVGAQPVEEPMGAAEKVDQSTPWTREEVEQKLRALGRKYHIYHPYQVAMNSGKLTREQIQGWVYNRFYYQIAIPIKDAAILSNMPDREHRRKWIQRIIDHDGTEGDEGGIEAWIWLGEACG